MKTVLKTLAIVIGLATAAPLAHAQETADPAPASTDNSSRSGGLLFVEPGLTYTFGSDTTGEVDNADDSSGKANGFGISGRLGFHIREIFFAGLDGRYSWLDFEDSGLGGSSDATAFNWGPFAGVQMPNVGLRVWAGYVAGGNLDPEEIGSGASGIDVKASDAKGYRVGAGFRVTSVSLNLEYQDIRYNDAEKQGGIFSGNYDSVKLHDKGFIASVSFPFEL